MTKYSDKVVGDGLHKTSFTCKYSLINLPKLRKSDQISLSVFPYQLVDLSVHSAVYSLNLLCLKIQKDLIGTVLCF